MPSTKAEVMPPATPSMAPLMALVVTVPYLAATFSAAWVTVPLSATPVSTRSPCTRAPAASTSPRAAMAPSTTPRAVSRKTSSLSSP